MYAYLIIFSGILPDSWLMGKLFLIHKNKGDPSLPENCRPITILSCLGKLFTSVLNARLTRFLDEFKILSEHKQVFEKIIRR